MKEIKDMAASVHNRLLDRARKAGRPFQELLEHFGMERFLYRLSTCAGGLEAASPTGCDPILERSTC